MKELIQKMKEFEQFDWLIVASVIAVIGTILVWTFFVPHQPPYVERPKQELVVNPDAYND